MSDMPDVFHWIQAAYEILVTVFAIWSIIDKKSHKTDLRISTLEKTLIERLDAHAERLAKLEATVEKSPTHHDLSKVYDEIRKVSDTIASLAISVGKIGATLESLEKLQNRMDNYWRHKPE